MTIEVGPTPTIEETRSRAMVVIRRQHILDEIGEERESQDRTWGSPLFDDRRTTADFVGWIIEYATGMSERAGRHDFRTRLIKAAAIAVAAVESIDRDNRPV